jgi:hydrogenase expression/formation protein HypE
MPIGKLDNRLLEDIIKHYTGIRDKRIILAPKVGEDAGAFIIDDKVIVIHSDPITGASINIGRLAIHIAGNDIASTGVKPEWYTLVIILPINSSLSLVEQIMKEANEALLEINASLLGGHTEFSPSVKSPIVSATAIGVGRKDAIISTGGAEIGDYILMTKTAGIEATGIIAWEKEAELTNFLDKKEIEEAKKFLKKISIIDEALLLSEKRLANSLHDPTEGGILNGLFEIAYSSGKTIEINVEAIPVHPLTKKILGYYGLDPLKSLSSGSLLASVSREKTDHALYLLRQRGIKTTIIGRVIGKGGKLIVRQGNAESVITESINDEFITRFPGDAQRVH